MAKQTDDNIERCKAIFPTWSWIAGIISGGIIIVASCVFVYATQETRQDLRLAEYETRFSHLEAIHADIDTVKKILRERNKQRE